jgi:arylsulfatase A
MQKKLHCLALSLLGLLLLTSLGLAKPNVILIMADDVSWECFGCYGAEDYQTPRIDALAAKGLRFSHCYSTPICTTSRVKLMTGQYNFRNYTHFGYLNPSDKTFAQLMKSAGYKTAVAGKWQLNGLSNDLPGYLDANRPHQAGFDEYMLWQLTQQKAVPGGGERFWSPLLEHNGRLITPEESHGKYGPDMFCDFLCDFIQRNQAEPFFVYYPMALVHDPFVPTPDTIGDRDRSQKANRPSKSPQEQKENFVAMVNYMDKIIGRIVDKVEEIGQLENTIILFTADNGTNTAITSRWNGQDIRGGKAGTTDMGTHVPFVAYWKDHTPRGTVVSDLIDFTDFYPTLAAIAGIPMGADDPQDGRSFLPQLVGKPGHPRDWVLCHYQPYWNKAPGQFARNQQFKLYRDGRFYEVPNDLQEKHDLGSQATSAEAVQARQLLSELLERCPPAPTEIGDRLTKERPTYPNWQRLIEPND